MVGIISVLLGGWYNSNSMADQPIGACPQEEMCWNMHSRRIRGIALTSVVYKVFCMILNNRLSEVVDEFHLLAEEQGGFRKGRGCQDQVLTLLLVAQSSVARKKEGCLTAFIDFSKAYDRVHRGKLWRCLESVGMSGKFLEVLQSLYMENCMQVKVDDQLRDPFRVEVGLRQVCILSPMLFSLYING